jgi:hypothetical protein
MAFKSNNFKQLEQKFQLGAKVLENVCCAAQVIALIAG